jgi:SAM-dependent methyltransferase
MPRADLRQLIRDHEIGIGSKVLDVGCGVGDVVRYLRFLAIDASGLCHSADEAARASRAVPDGDFFWAAVSQGIPLAEHQFDAVLIRDLRENEGDLFSRAALAATANLLACVRPGGLLLARVRCSDESPDNGGGHTLACYAQQLSAFPGKCRVSGPSTGCGKWHPLKRLFAIRPDSAILTASLKIPEDPISRAEWHRLAAHASEKRSAPCCNRSNAAAGESELNRSAA